MPFRYKYFNRDISWLNFNYRVLEEAKDVSVPLGERMRFLAIYSSNLDEFYSVRVAEYCNAADGNRSMPEVTNPAGILGRINAIVSNQIAELSDILKNQICPELLRRGIVLYHGKMPQAEEHQDFMRRYFMREVIPYLQPVLISSRTRVFLRGNRPYFAIKLFAKSKKSAARRRPTYALIKLPFNDLPRFIELPKMNRRHVVFLDDIIRQNMQQLFPGYDIDGMWSMKVTRDSDLGLDDDVDIVEQIRENLVQRNIGAPAGLYHDRDIAPDLLECLRLTFSLGERELVASDRYMNLHDLMQLPARLLPNDTWTSPNPLIHHKLQQAPSVISAVRKGDILLHFPFHSFHYVTRMLNEAALDPKTAEIKLTLYRVATNSAVVSALIAAARSGKKVTVFVELKARFDEKNNLELSEAMMQAGIKVIYSIPGLKVHAKMALIIRQEQGIRTTSCAYLATGNFNEVTAQQYTDHGLLTCNEAIISDLEKAFDYLEDQSNQPELDTLLLTQVNMVSELSRLIDSEIAKANRGEDAYILLKMNGLQNRPLINKLYDASCAGVKIDLIVRGICCLVPQQPFSQNITVRRIVDSFLEHGRIWIFGRRTPKIYLTSSDLLNRNIYKRIELAFPIMSRALRGEILNLVDIWLSDNTKSRMIDCNMQDQKILRTEAETAIRAQRDIYLWLKAKEDEQNAKKEL